VETVLGGGLELGACHEIRAELARDIGPATGFLIALLALYARRKQGRIMWISDATARADSGQLYPHGLARFGLDPGRMLFVHPVDLKSALWAADEAVRCSDVQAVIFHVKGNPRALDLTAIRRLILHARQSGVTLFLLRQSGQEEASGVLTRWGVKALNALPNALPGTLTGSRETTGNLSASRLSLARNHTLIGPTRLALALERNRSGPLGQWDVAWNPSERRFTHAASAATHFSTASSSFTHRPYRPDEMGQVLALATSADKSAVYKQAS